jgi:hypothetical protein
MPYREREDRKRYDRERRERMRQAGTLRLAGPVRLQMAADVEALLAEGSLATIVEPGGRYAGETRRELRTDRGRLARVPGRGDGLARSAARVRIRVEPRVRVGIPLAPPLPLAARRDVPVDPDRSPGIRPVRPVPGCAVAGDDAPRPGDRAGRSGFREGHPARGVGRLRHIHPLRSDAPGARVLAHPVHRVRGAEACRGLPVGVDGRVLGGVARQHPRRVGRAPGS